MTKISLTSWSSVVVSGAMLFVGGDLYRIWIQSSRELPPITHSMAEASSPVLSGTGRGETLQGESSVHKQGEKSVSASANIYPDVNSSAVIVARTFGSSTENVNQRSLKERSDSSASRPTTESSSVGQQGSFASGAEARGEGSAATAGGETRAVVVAPPGVSIPAAFGNPVALGDLSESQKAKIAQIAHDFTQSVQSSGAAPNTPEYTQAWNTAAYRADEYFRGQFGIPAFNAMQMSRVYQR